MATVTWKRRAHLGGGLFYFLRRLSHGTERVKVLPKIIAQKNPQSELNVNDASLFTRFDSRNSSREGWMTNRFTHSFVDCRSYAHGDAAPGRVS